MLGNVCVVKECGLPAAYHLCLKHAFPGGVVEVLPAGQSFVIGCWFAERKGSHFLLTLNDYTLGKLFGNRKQFEEQLISDGYTQVRLIPTEEDVRTIFVQCPRLIQTPWVPNPDTNEGLIALRDRIGADCKHENR
jgi:hypothetical protein